MSVNITDKIEVEVEVKI